MPNMEEAYATVAALPAVVEGDRGVYEHETMPAAALMRRNDGSTTRDYFYTEIHANASKREQMDPELEQPEARPATRVHERVDGLRHAQLYEHHHAGGPFASATPTRVANKMTQQISGGGGFNPFDAGLGIAPTAPVDVIVDLSSTVGTSMFEAAKQYVYGYADEFRARSREFFGRPRHRPRLRVDELGQPHVQRCRPGHDCAPLRDRHREGAHVRAPLHRPDRGRVHVRQRVQQAQRESDGEHLRRHEHGRRGPRRLLEDAALLGQEHDLRDGVDGDDGAGVGRGDLRDGVD